MDIPKAAFEGAAVLLIAAAVGLMAKSQQILSIVADHLRDYREALRDLDGVTGALRDEVSALRSEVREVRIIRQHTPE